ncbi:MAG: hypothetical protein WA888_06710 [Burkholderiaceae bacterium]
MLLKLLCVTVLTANGIVLHFLSFPVLAGSGPLTLREGMFLASAGALSSSHWMLAAFIGVARPLGRVPIDTLLVCFVSICVFTILIGLARTPQVRRRLTNWRLAHEISRLPGRSVA